ncbi:MAG: TIGR00725 family protein, partial [Nitrospirae bacterium]|nr:TIGR00725 family protein [Nitrospirota bacterium]
KAEAFEVGRLIAVNNAMLVCGGLSGVMYESARGAKSAGGTTIGILPYDDKKSANEFIDIPIATGLGVARNIIIAKTADALIAVNGEYGTLSEIAFGLQLNKPVVGINTWDIKGVIHAKDAEEAVIKTFKFLEGSALNPQGNSSP